MPRKLSCPMAVLALFALIGPFIAFAQQEDEPESWIDSPEAYFATRAEQAEWEALTTRAEKEAFRTRYWLKRDPTPGTARNEFREMVLQRIKIADGRFPIDQTTGARTARGKLFVVLGSPAIVRDLRQPPLPAPPPPGAEPSRVPIGVVEGNETTSHWSWDRQRTPEVLKTLGLPSLELTVVIEPSRKRDRLQNPGLFNSLRESLAERSITNPQLIAGSVTDPAESAAVAAIDTVSESKLNSAISATLADAAAATRSPRGQVFGQAMTWRDEKAVTVLWFFLPDVAPVAATNLTMHGTITTAAGDEIGTFSKPVTHDRRFVTSRPGVVSTVRVALPPGDYIARAGVFDTAHRAIVTSRANIKVPKETQFSVPNLLLAGGANPAGAATTGDFILGRVEVLPRADATFLPSESLWYFFDVLSPADAKRLKAEVRIRRGTDWLGTPRLLDAHVEDVGGGRYVGGFEMPLATLEPGDYSLYVTLRDGEHEVVRRGDFQILAR